MGNRTLRDLCWDLRHILVGINLENLAAKRSLLQALRHSPPTGFGSDVTVRASDWPRWAVTSLASRGPQRRRSGEGR
ncbi:hypothetical protein NDU88_000122 [Pleurodeles waltl]|uniref:Uncharacterized protein n=1 Tax=Pleurodeles waltl TaxID=8319 RepID=A0AAV7SW37_PLEWA|nr:hypothetical protein NDU88_000122 [Pleurodeles waltl]